MHHTKVEKICAKKSEETPHANYGAQRYKGDGWGLFCSHKTWVAVLANEATLKSPVYQNVLKFVFY